MVGARDVGETRDVVVVAAVVEGTDAVVDVGGAAVVDVDELVGDVDSGEALPATAWGDASTEQPAPIVAASVTPSRVPRTLELVWCGGGTRARYRPNLRRGRRRCGLRHRRSLGDDGAVLSAGAERGTP